MAEVSADAPPTGRTRHIADGEIVKPFVALAITRYADADGYYLFCLDAEGDVVTDPYHDTLEAAVAQAEHEYVGLRWRSPGVD